jgi:GNAT superfamily N-acetyltransferase
MLKIMKDTLSSNFGIIVVPKACDDANLWQLLIQKSKSFRLSSLKESPEAFASTYTREAAFEDDVWADRLANSRATMFVAIRDAFSEGISSEHGKVQALVDKEWLAMTVTIETQESALDALQASQSPWQTATKAQDDADVQSVAETLSFILNGVYVAPGHRKVGIGIATLDRVFDVGRAFAKTRGRRAVHFQVRVYAANAAASKLYEKAGFQEVRQELMQIDEKVKNGVALGPHEAVMLVMERHVSVTASS